MFVSEGNDLEHTSTQDLRASVEAVSIPTNSNKAEFTNWAKTFRCKPQRVFAPTTIGQCRSIMELARREGARLHPVGVGHSPSDLACTNGWLMRMEGIKGFVGVSLRARTTLIYRSTPKPRQQLSLAVRRCTTSTHLYSNVNHLLPFATLDLYRIKQLVGSSRQPRMARGSHFPSCRVT